VGARVLSLRNPLEKMSKSDPDPNAKILLTDPDDVIRKKIATAVTDSGHEVAYDREQKPGISNLLEIAATISGESVAELAARHRDGGYGAFKRAVAEAVIEGVRPVRDRVQEYLAHPEAIDEALERGRSAAHAEAKPMLDEVGRAIGLSLH